MELNSFYIFNRVSSDLKSFIKSFYVFGNLLKTALFVTIDDKVFGFGENSYGVCGQGHNQFIRELLMITELCDKGVKEFFNGKEFVLCLTSDNKLFSWGYNDHGQLGIGCANKYRYYEPQLIHSLDDGKIVQVCCGERHSLVLTEEGVVYGWGDNKWGQTGGGQEEEIVITSPKQWNIGSNVIKIHCSSNQSFAVTSEGRVSCCGWNDHCQLGSQWDKDARVSIPSLSDNMVNVESIITSWYNTYYVTQSGDIYLCQFDCVNSLHEEQQKVPLCISNFNNPQSLTSSNYTLNNMVFGIIYCENSIYELKSNEVKNTECETFEKYFGEQNMTYKTFHINHDDLSTDLLLCSTITEKIFPRYLRYENDIDKFGISDYVAEDLKEIIKYFHVITCGDNILFVTIDDKVFGFGDNRNGILGLGHMDEIESVEVIPELCDEKVEQFFCGENFILCLTIYNKLYSWGRNDHGQLGVGKFNEYKTFKPQLVEYFETKNIVQVCCGKYHCSVLTSDNCVHLWGYHDKQNIINPIECEFNEEIESIHCSIYQTFFVTKSGKVFYWEKDYANLKLISIKTITDIKFICSSHDYTYFISQDLKIFIFHTNKIIFEIETKSIFKNSIVQNNFMSISIHHPNVIFDNDNSVYELSGQSLLETKYKNPFDYYCDRYRITYNTNELKVVENMNLIASNTTNTFIKNFIEQENNLSIILKPFYIADKISIPRSFIKFFHVFRDNFGYNILFITNDDNVYGLGDNYFGCCGLGHNDRVGEPQLIIELCYSNVIKFFNGLKFAMALTNDKELYAWGILSQDYSLSKPTKIFISEFEIENICCANDHALILTEDGIVYGWGNNSNCRIKNDEEEIFILVPLKLDELTQIKIIFCSNEMSIVVSEDNLIYVREKHIRVITVIECDHDILNICADENDLYILTQNKKLLHCFVRSDKKVFKEIEFPSSTECTNVTCINDNVTGLFLIYIDGVVLFVIEDCVYYLIDQKLVSTQYENVFQYCAEELQITHKTIYLNLQNEIQTNELNIKGKNIITNGQKLMIKFNNKMNK